MDCPVSLSRVFPPVLVRAVAAITACLAVFAGAGVATTRAQTIDEPGVHLADPDYSRIRTAALPEGAPVAPMRGSDQCRARARHDADRHEDCVIATDERTRQRNLEAAERSGVEMGTHVIERAPRPPAQRNR